VARLVVLIYGVLFVPRVTVAVVDKTGGTPNRDHRERTVRHGGSRGADKHHWQCNHRVFRDCLSDTSRARGLPGELSYQQNGLMFGSRLIQETRSVSIPDPGV
jgi:conjugal transfer mating pair stabilization protein TraG